MTSPAIPPPLQFIVINALRRTCLLLVLLIAFANYSHAITLEHNASRTELNSGVQFLEDPTGRLTIDEVRSADAQRRFTPWKDPDALNFGLTRSAYWVKVTLKGSQSVPAQWVLEIPYTGLDFIDFYAPGSPPVLTGSARRFESRPVEYRYFIFPFQLSAEDSDYYFRIESRYALTFDLVAWEPKSFFVNQQKSLAMQALYFGELLALLLYNVFLFASLRDRRFLYYVLFAASLGLGIFAGNGFGRELLWRDSEAFDGVSQTLFVCLAMGFGNLFAALITQASQVAPVMARLMRASTVFLGLAAALLLLSVWLPLNLQLVYQALGIVGILSCVLVLASTLQAIRRKVRGAGLFMLAWGLLMMGGIIAGLRIFNLLPTNAFTSYSLQIASAAELLLLAFLLAGLIRVERQAAEEAQRHALAVSKELLQVTRESEARLESTVRERTYDLNLALDQQKNMLMQHLRFGELISHEFRNPLSIIESQASVIKKQKDRSENDLNSRLDEIRAAAARLKKLFEQWIQNDRMMQPNLPLNVVSVNCRDFLQEIQDRNPVLARSHPLAFEVDTDIVHLSFDKELIEIALLNLIDNAAKYSPAASPILVNVSKEPGYVRFSVSDEGLGIAIEDRDRIFEDHVRLDASSKPGLGLGLPLVKKIAEMHLAYIRLDSEPGKGSRFSMFLPDDLAERLMVSAGAVA